MAQAPTYRLVTRSDFDGLACAVLLKRVFHIGEITFVHPKDMQDGKVQIGPLDITANLPFVDGAAYAFDHHKSEEERLSGKTLPKTYVNNPDAPSAARVIYDHFGAEKFADIPGVFMTAVDKADSAAFEAEDVLIPKGWDLLGFITDARTGLGRFKEFRISNYELMMKLVDLLQTFDIDRILADPDVKERVDLYAVQHQLGTRQIRELARTDGNVVVLDLRSADPIYAVNRFLIYALYLECTVSVHVMWGKDKQNVVLAIGSSIFFPCKTDIGKLCLKYGGGGHPQAGTCQVDVGDADRVLAEVTAALKE